MPDMKNAFVTITLVLSLCSVLSAQNQIAAYNDPPSRVRGLIEQFGEDYGFLDRFYSAGTSANRSARMRELYAGDLAVLNATDFDKLSHDEQIDYILFKNYLEHETREQMRRDAQMAEMALIIPFAKT